MPTKLYLYALLIAAPFILTGCTSIDKSVYYTPEYKVGIEQLRVYDKHVQDALQFAPHSDIKKLRESARVRTKELLLKAQRHFGVDELELTSIDFTWKLTEAAAASEFLVYRNTERRVLRIENARISINEIMFLRNVTTFMNDSIPHEVAHIVSAQVNGCYDHMCRKFKEVMEFLGTTSKSHNMETYFSCKLNREFRLVTTPNPQTLPVCEKRFE